MLGGAHPGASLLPLALLAAVLERLTPSRTVGGDVYFSVMARAWGKACPKYGGPSAAMPLRRPNRPVLGPLAVRLLPFIGLIQGRALSSRVPDRRISSGGAPVSFLRARCSLRVFRLRE